MPEQASDQAFNHGLSHKQQKQFSTAIRSHNVSDQLHLEPRRLAIYRDLFFNNVESFAASAFPVLKEIIVERLSADYWQKMVRDFMVLHRCETPYFLEISEEFLAFLQTALNQQQYPELPPYSWQLAHWEWMELHADVTNTESSMMISTLNNEQLANAHVSLSETAWVCAYEYPVHRISAETWDAGAQPTYLMVYRNGQDEVGFNEINPLCAALFEAIRQQPGVHVETLLTHIADESGLDVDLVLKGGTEILQQWQRLCILFAQANS